MARNHDEARPGIETYVRTNRFWYAIQVGIFAAVIWGAVRWGVYSFRFTQVQPGFLLKPFVDDDSLSGTMGFIWGALTFLVLSILVSLLYAFALYKLRGPWPGIAYGILWFALLYLLYGMLTGAVPPFGKISWDSLWTDFSIFVLWGTFIGYSISFEFTDERQRNKGKTMLNLQ